MPPTSSVLPPTDADFLHILHENWGYDSFRGIQLDIIRSIAAGHDTLGLMPTGGGKSLTFQVPALALDGVCLVVTPLIALMKDQVSHLLQRGIRAAAIYSGLSRADIQRHLNNTVYGGNKFLYISPERLATEAFQVKLRQMRLAFIAVDEAHCISQWGYDFRPSYLEIARIRDIVPDVPVLALTASATPRVVDDICRQLRFRPGAQVFRMSFERCNLSYIVRQTEDKAAELLHILRSVTGSAIVYTRSRLGARDTARMLEAEGISAFYYHAGLTDVDKDVRQRAWQEGETRVMVATNAFGMGIDKPDVRLVIHLDLPDSLEAYFQEAGRAGRDGLSAYAVLLYNRRDRVKLRRRVPDTFPEKDYIRDVYDHLAYFFEVAVGDGYLRTYDFDLTEFCRAYHYFPVPVTSALKLLTRAGYIDYREEGENHARLMFLTTREELYKLNYLDARADSVLRAVLRLYGGIFSDYVSIEEQRLGLEAGLTGEAVYETLKDLTRQRILHYVPRKSTPQITFTQRREDGRDVIIPKEVYEVRRADYEARINAMLAYAEETTQCRSRMLLNYFGETSAADCGHCDVCIARRARRTDPRDVAKTFLALLADGRPHPVSDFRPHGVPTDVVAAALQWLVDEGKARFDDGLVVKC